MSSNDRSPIELEGSESSNHVLLKSIIKSPNIEVGDYTFYHDFFDPHKFEVYNAGYFNCPMPVKLIIGKYCSIAHGVIFLSSVTNHPMDGSTFPFAPLYGSDKTGYDHYWPDKGNTTVGNDVWIGCEAMIMPGVSIGDGAIIGARALVTKDVEPYTIVGGNPAKLLRHRFDDKIRQKLLDIQWWNWPHELAVSNAKAIVSNDLERLSEIQSSLDLG